jgi:DNA polymerase III subunit epsilon
MGELFLQYKNRRLRKKIDPGDLHPAALKHLQAAEKVNLAVNLEDAHYIVFDTELTGLNLKKDSIVSIGAVKMCGGKIDLMNTYYRVVEPASLMSKKSVVIHGITPSEASECPTIDVLLPEFLDFCGNGILVGHFVAIDVAFVNKAMSALLGLPLQNPAVDTQALYRWIRGKEEQYCAFHAGMTEEVALLTLAQRYEIPVSEAHNALNDAFITAQLFQRFLTILRHFKICTVEDLIGIGKPRGIG